jgi:predicted dehydrogenase
MMPEKLRFGILSTGVIARTFALSLAQSRTSELVAVASRTTESAARFAREFSVPHAYDSYQALLADSEVDVVYIATPHPWHAQWAVAAACAKKHVLCEKPLAMNHAEVSAVVAAARDNDVFLMEAFMYRCHPQTRALLSLLRSGTLGSIKGIQAAFGVDGVFPRGSRMISNELGGGGILDLGCYPVSMARLIAGVAITEPFSEPSELKALGRVGRDSHVDEHALAILEFPGEILASVATSVQLWQENGVRIFGSEGRLLVSEPWHPAQHRDHSELLIERPGRAAEIVRVPARAGALYGYEIDAVAAQIDQRQAQEMTLADSLGNALTLDRWRRAIGVTFTADGLGA